MKKNYVRGDKPTSELQHQSKREEFNITLSNKFQALQELRKKESVDDRWQRLEEVVK